MRLMTWNCLGMTDNTKQGLLRAYKISQGIDVIILQEGDQTFDNAESEACTASGVVFLTDQTNPTVKALDWVFDCKSILYPMSGVSRKAYYNVVANIGTFTAIADSASVNYGGNTEVMKWLLMPTTAALGSHKLKWESGRSRSGLKVGSQGSGRIEDLIKSLIRDPTQKRVNLFGHRRPKKINLTTRGIDVYYWHAPLGQDTRLSDVGFTGDDAYKGRGCGGELAVAANRLFAKLLCPGGVFPANTIVCGDLNIKADAAKHIYNTANVVSDADEEWCHVIAASTLPLTMVTNTLDQTALGYSDHPPLVVDF